MSLYQCKVCQGVYEDPQPDGGRYFHVCPLVPNPAYEEQFTVDEDGLRVPKGKFNARIPRRLPWPDARNENVERKPDGTMAAKAEGPGKERL